MKKIVLFIIVVLATQSNAFADNFTKLVALNKCWVEQQDVATIRFEQYKPVNEKDWIALHLSLVERTLKGRSVAHLSKSQQSNRNRCLGILQRYKMAGNFPKNEDYNYRTPIFIDKHDNFCAVGFLIKETGNESVARKISATTNLAYVREMNYPELDFWAKENGFTIDELAWIQPGYLPNTSCAPIAGGVEGEVKELYVDEATQQMFVGGKFNFADKTIIANNIAFVTENVGNYTWHKMGLGVNGSVNAITKFDGKIFIGGSFTTAGSVVARGVAYWNGLDWASAGCLDGVVNDLIVFKGSLYAAGNFKSCGTGVGYNFAKWKGIGWEMIGGTTGRINTMEEYDNAILLGGAMDFGTATNINAIKWDSTNSFRSFDSLMNKEVMDFELYYDTLYASCKRTSLIDSNNLVYKLRGNEWTKGLPEITRYHTFATKGGVSTINTMCYDHSIKGMYFGGYFTLFPGIGTVFANSSGVGGTAGLYLDSTVNKIVVFKKEIIFGGAFKKGYQYYSEIVLKDIKVNGITKKIPNPTKIVDEQLKKETLKLYPNPIKSGGVLQFEIDFTATEYQIMDIAGKQIARGKVNTRSELKLPQLSASFYLVTLSNEDGQQAKGRFLVE